MSQPEARLSRKIMEAMRKQGAWVYKVWGNEKTPAGIPDIVGTYQGLFVAVETKMPGGRVSDIQVHRIKTIRAHGGLVCVARNVETALEMLSHVATGDHDRCLMSRQDCPYWTGAIK